jgi:magnesium transporter
MLDEKTAAVSQPDVPALRDADGAIDEAFVALVAAAIEAGDATSLKLLVGDLHEADTGDLIEALDGELRPKLIALMGRDFDFTALTEVDDAVREEILEELPNETIAAGVRELDSDDAVYILEDLSEEDQEAVLAALPAPERVALEKSLDYPEDSAGRRMQTEFIAVPPMWTVGHTIDYMRDNADLPDRFFEIYVVDPAFRLMGAVSLDRLLRTKRPISIASLMDPDRRSIAATEDVAEVARKFEHYNLVAAPVTDAGDRLVGVITIDDIVDVIEEEADEDLKALGGVKGDEELSDSVVDTVRSRFPWLFANLITAVLSASVIALFEGAIEKMVALAVLMPIVASMGGNAGTQTMTVTVRALATRELSASNVSRVVLREVCVGALNGLAFAAILGTVAVVWFGVRDLGFVIGMAIITVLTAAAMGGILIPLALHRMGIDPAVSSGPFVTTITDVIGFFAFLGIASLWFGLM